jgi:cysteine desulfuration protein SufE
VTAEPLPPSLAEIVDVFATSPPRDRLEMLLEYANELPPLPQRLAEHPERLEAVPECQSPLFVTTEIGDGVVHIYADAPAEAPTTRGFAGIFHAGLDGLPPDTILGIPDDITARLGLAEVVSPLRLRGAAALLGRIQRQVREQLAARRRDASRRPTVRLPDNERSGSTARSALCCRRRTVRPTPRP